MKILNRRPILSYITVGMIVGLATFYVCSIEQEKTQTTYSYKKLTYVKSQKRHNLVMRDEFGKEESYKSSVQLMIDITEKNLGPTCFKLATTGYRYFKTLDFSYRNSLASIENENKCK